MRALLVQALEPRAMAAVDQHSKFREDPWGRLERTTHFVMATTYGDTAAAEAAARDGSAPCTPASTASIPSPARRYSGSDPDLLLWIHAVEVESFVLVVPHVRGSPVATPTPTATWSRWARVAEMVELPPRDGAAVDGRAARLPAVGARPLQVTPAAFDGLRVVLFPPMHLAVPPAVGDPHHRRDRDPAAYARRMYRMPWFPGAGLPVRAAVFALSRALNLVTPTPPVVREAQARVEGREAARASGRSAGISRGRSVSREKCHTPVFG